MLDFAIRMPSVLSGLTVHFNSEIIIFFLELWSSIPIFMEQTLGKNKEFIGEKVTIIFPFLP
jgi:hypothetical protein